MIVMRRQWSPPGWMDHSQHMAAGQPGGGVAMHIPDRRGGAPTESATQAKRRARVHRIKVKTLHDATPGHQL